MSAKITRDEERRCFEKWRLCGPNMKTKESDRGGRCLSSLSRHAHATGRCTLRVVLLADGPTYSYSL